MKQSKSGNGWRIVQYTSTKGTYLHFYGSCVAKAKSLATKYLRCYTNGREYIQVKASDFPITLVF